MAHAFDQVAKSYDQTFTHSNIGRLQRQQVWNYLTAVLPQMSGRKALEFGCGTGEDALMLARNGFKVMATDASIEMIAQARQKAELNGSESKIQLQHLDLNSFESFQTDEKFDLVFSNFGALNCISPASFEKLLGNLSSRLNLGSRVIFVVLQKTCLWEILYFAIKLKFKSALRRWQRNGTEASVEGVKIKTWYYSPESFMKIIPAEYELINFRAVGCAVPPSYMESYFSRHPGFLNGLSKMDLFLTRFSFFGRIADHFLVDLTLK